MDKTTKMFLTYVVNNTEYFDKDTLTILNSGNIKVFWQESEKYLRVTDNETLINHEGFVPVDYDDFLYTFSDNFGRKYVDHFSVVNMSYSEQLRHHKWKEKRTEILLERGNKCERCGSVEFLQVHHKKYLKNKLAWEYENSMLECLCGGCHMKEHGITKESKRETKEQELLREESISYEEMTKIKEMKTLILLNLSDGIVNKIISLNSVVRINTDVIYFRNDCQEIRRYLQKKFGDKVKCNYSEVGFNIKKCIQVRDYKKLKADCRAKQNK